MFIITTMSNYYKVKTKKLKLTQYRSYVIKKNNHWITKPVLIMDIYNCYPNTDKWVHHNHPLVNKGLAFWVNKTYICIGYKWGDVFRPIFNYRRENQLYSVRRDIVKYAKILSSNARHSLYKKEIMKMHNKKIPVEIVEHIVNYTWDIMLLLK